MVLGWLCYRLRSGEASVMDRQMRDRDERDRDKILIFSFAIVLQCNFTCRIAL